MFWSLVASQLIRPGLIVRQMLRLSRSVDEVWNFNYQDIEMLWLHNQFSLSFPRHRKITIQYDGFSQIVLSQFLGVIQLKL